MSWAKYNGKRKNLQYSVLHSFLSFLVLNCGFSTTTTMRCGKKGKPSSPFGSAGGWRVLGPCVVVHRLLAFFLSLYIGLRDYTVSMWIQTVSIYQHEKKNPIAIVLEFCKEDYWELKNDTPFFFKNELVRILMSNFLSIYEISPLVLCLIWGCWRSFPIQ